jgi:heptosyltransferase-2
MYPILPDGESFVTHNTLGKDKINPIKIFSQLKQILN